jgi:hypothetical protein
MQAVVRCRRVSILMAVFAALSGCSGLPERQTLIDQTETMSQDQRGSVQRSITGFASALRCMDSLLLDHGVRDVSMLIEEIEDATLRVDAGTRDMLVSAMSDMTRRSQAIRLSGYGMDIVNLATYLDTAQRQSAYRVVPQYDIKGSVTQFDEQLARDQRDAGVGWQPFLNLAEARVASSSVLGLDLSMLRTADLVVLPGVTSHNAVAILEAHESGGRVARYHKFGTDYVMNLNQADGVSQALRGLAELATIELAGKLTKVPYWHCLGSDARTDEEVRREVSDWYFAMAARPAELISHFQGQLRRRGVYAGPIDGLPNAALAAATADHRAALGLGGPALLDEAFFAALLTAERGAIARPNKASALGREDLAHPTTVTTAVTTGPIRLRLSLSDPHSRVARGQPFGLRLQLDRDAHVYCYLQDEHARITRLFPNRFAKDSLVSATQPLLLPGKMRFQLAMTTPRASESISCFATPQDVAARLPRNVFGLDFEPLSVDSMGSIVEAFVATAGGSVVRESLQVHAD